MPPISGEASENSLKAVNGTDSEAFKTTINGETYWANVKMHIPMNGEVLYTIEKEKPDDLIEGVPT